MSITNRVAIFLYSLILITSASLILTGYHRLIYEFSGKLSLPEFAEAALTGMLNLGWNEYAYLIGKPTKRVEVFDLLPIVASVSSIIVVGSLYFRLYLGLRLAILYLFFGAGISAMSLVVLIKQGAEDTWRLTVAASFLFSNIIWYLYFRKLRKKVELQSAPSKI